MLATLLLYVICATPFLMLIFIGYALVAAARRGQYDDDPLRTGRRESPAPATAAARIAGPMVMVLLVAIGRHDIGPMIGAGLAVAIIVLALLVYRAAEQRRLENPKQ